MGHAIVAIAGVLLGFIAGLLSYRQSRRWCGRCGGSLACPTCVPIGPTRSS
jgi:hypothetical protein